MFSFLHSPDEGLVSRLLTTGGPEITQAVETLLKGEVIQKRIDEEFVLRDLEARSGAVWSLLLLSRGWR